MRRSAGAGPPGRPVRPPIRSVPCGRAPGRPRSRPRCASWAAARSLGDPLLDGVDVLFQVPLGVGGLSALQHALTHQRQDQRDHQHCAGHDQRRGPVGQYQRQGEHGSGQQPAEPEQPEQRSTGEHPGTHADRLAFLGDLHLQQLQFVADQPRQCFGEPAHQCADRWLGPLRSRAPGFAHPVSPLAHVRLPRWALGTLLPPNRARSGSATRSLRTHAARCRLFRRVTVLPRRPRAPVQPCEAAAEASSRTKYWHNVLNSFAENAPWVRELPLPWVACPSCEKGLRMYQTRSARWKRGKRSLATLSTAALLGVGFAVPAYAAGEVFISEIHYDNAGTDTGEAIEVQAPEGTDLTGWQVVLFNGSGGGVYDTE